MSAAVPQTAAEACGLDQANTPALLQGNTMASATESASAISHFKLRDVGCCAIDGC